MSHKTPLSTPKNPPHLVALSTFFRDAAKPVPFVDHPEGTDYVPSQFVPSQFEATETKGTEESPPESTEGQFSDAGNALKFIMGGKAIFTLVSNKTGQRFTYKVNSKDMDNGGKIYFVSVLVGPDNWENYKYLGYIKSQYSGYVYYHGNAKAKIAVDAPSAKAFAWAYHRLASGVLPESLQVWHSSNCGRCGRTLTVPSSVSQGFGPECVKHVH